MSKSLDALKKAVEELAPMSGEAWEAFSTIWHPLVVDKKQKLSSTNDKHPYFYFNIKGMLRWVYTSEVGNEITIEFIQEGAFSGYQDHQNQCPRDLFALQALSRSQVLRCEQQELNRLMGQYSDIEHFIRCGLCLRTEALLHQLVVLKSYTSQEKCHNVLMENPELLQLVPQKYIANHLGIHATNFSKYLKTQAHVS